MKKQKGPKSEKPVSSKATGISYSPGKDKSESIKGKPKSEKMAKAGTKKKA